MLQTSLSFQLRRDTKEKETESGIICRGSETRDAEPRDTCRPPNEDIAAGCERIGLGVVNLPRESKCMKYIICVLSSSSQHMLQRHLSSNLFHNDCQQLS